jgi:hypothetical protein
MVSKVNSVYLMRNDEEIKELSDEEKIFVKAYEYILSDEWGKGRVDPLAEEMKRISRRKANNCRIAMRK